MAVRCRRCGSTRVSKNQNSHKFEWECDMCGFEFNDRSDSQKKAKDMREKDRLLQEALLDKKREKEERERRARIEKEERERRARIEKEERERRARIEKEERKRRKLIKIINQNKNLDYNIRMNLKSKIKYDIIITKEELEKEILKEIRNKEIRERRESRERRARIEKERRIEIERKLTEEIMNTEGSRVYDYMRIFNMSKEEAIRRIIELRELDDWLERRERERTRLERERLEKEEREEKERRKRQREIGRKSREDAIKRLEKSRKLSEQRKRGKKSREVEIKRLERQKKLREEKVEKERRKREMGRIKKGRAVRREGRKSGESYHDYLFRINSQ